MEKINNRHPDDIILHGIYFDELSYRNLMPVNIPKDEIKAGKPVLKVERSCVGLGDDKFIIHLDLVGYQEGVFNFVVKCTGIFTVPGNILDANGKNCSQKYLLSNSCIAILFPFVRERAMHLVNDSGYLNYVIQPFSIVDEFADKPDMEICYIGKPCLEESEDPISELIRFISIDRRDQTSMTKNEPDIREEIIHSISEVKDHIRKRKLDGNIVMSGTGFDLLERKLYQLLDENDMISSVDRKVTYTTINCMMEAYHIPINFVLFQDSTDGYKVAYAIFKKDKDSCNGKGTDDEGR